MPRGVVIVVGMVSLMAASLSAGADPPYYVRRATWHATLLASREALMKCEAERTGGAPRFGPWYCLGPFPRSSGQQSTRLDPRQSSVDLDRPYPGGRPGGGLRWQLRLDLKDGWVNPLFGGAQVAYLYRTITAPKPATTAVYVDAIGRLSVWLNGQPLLAGSNGHIVFSLWTPDVQLKPQKVPLKLKAGANDLLVRVALQPGARPSSEKDPWRRFTAEARRPWGTKFTGYSTETGPATEYEKLVYREISQLYFSTCAAPGPGAGPGAAARRSLWKLLRRDFPSGRARRQMQRERMDGIWRLDWTPGELRQLARRYAAATRDPELAAAASALAGKVQDEPGLAKVRELYDRSDQVHAGRQCLHDAAARRRLDHQITSLELAIADLIETYGDRYGRGAEFQSRLAAIRRRVERAEAAGQASQYGRAWGELQQLRQQALLANPLLDFDRLLLVRRRANPFLADRPMNWANNSSLAPTGYDNEIAVLSPAGPEGELSTLYRPEGGRFVGDVDLNFAADRLLFSMPDADGRWQVFQVRTDGTGLRQLTPGDQDDVDNFDACYLPNGKITFCSTAVFAGVPCVRGRDYVAVLYLMDRDGGNIRQLGFEQDQDWCPTVLNDGRLLYTRWEYTDIPHFFSRLLFSMNPDGTDQRAYYGSNSYWPNGIFYARPIPGHPTKVVGIVSGHHVARRSGELVLFDPARGQHEADGVVQRIPGRGQKVQPVVNDRLVVGSWPKFLHPFPLSDKYFLVSCRRSRQSRWGLYLADVFDNLLPLYEEPDYDCLEPIPLRPRRRPPVIPERIDLRQRSAIVNLQDVYAGPGLAGVPRGTVKRLRVIAYHYAYRNMADDSRAIGVDASWDTVKMVLGTVPVHEDGSAMFRVPANTPISIQPLDAQGKAVQLMRSWMTAMPGEVLSCVGCHTPSNQAPLARQTLAMQRGPSDITPWYGPVRGFSFQREVQPVLDRYCIGCHHDGPAADDRAPFSLAAAESSDPRGFPPAYLALHRFVRRPGAETDYHLLPAAEYHADVSELIQLLEKGHYGVRLDREAWDRLITWIDLNVPCHGTWSEAQGAQRVGDQRRRRRQLRRLYAGMDEDPEAIVAYVPRQRGPIVPPPARREPAAPVACPGWPFDAAEAARRQQAAGSEAVRTVRLSEGVTFELVRIPAGQFVMGDAAGGADEQPRRAQIAKPFWIGKFEVTNEQFAAFDPSHDSRYIRTHGISSTRGYPVNLPDQPVVRVSWLQAMDFCRWLSQKTGAHFTLPTEAQWEYACRAGTATPFFYGGLDSDFSPYANLADQMVEHLRDYSHNSKLAWMPRDERLNDHAMVTAPVGSYRPNAWGLYDMHGNASEWTRSPCEPGAGAASDAANTRMVVRGGSWRDRPKRCRSAFRIGYPAWQKVFNVGFRVVCED